MIERGSGLNMGVTTVLADDMPLDPRREISARLERLDGQLARMLRVGAEDAMLNDLNMIQHEIATLRLIFNSPWDNDKRRDLRMPSSIATIATVRGAEADCVVEDMSVGGALVHLDVDIRPGETIELTLPETGLVSARVVNISATGIHLAFPDINDEQISTILDFLQANYWR